MAMLAVCAVWDSAVQAYLRPLFVPHTGAAMRSFGDEVNRKSPDGNPLNAHPEDYELHHLAMFDEVNGQFHNVNGNDVDVVLSRGKDCVKNA